jgi:hypothetical protein
MNVARYVKRLHRSAVLEKNVALYRAHARSDFPLDLARQDRRN